MDFRIAGIVFITSFFAPTMLHAEKSDEATGRMAAGAHVGLDFANIHGNFTVPSGTERSHRSGFTAGGVFALRWGPILATQVELHFVRRRHDVDTGFPTSSFAFSYDYLEFPILARVDVPAPGPIEPSVYAGPTLGVLLDADARRYDGLHVEFTDRTERFDIGLMLGAGAAVEVGTVGAFTLDVRYNHGLRARNTNATSENEIKNRAFYVTVGYRADLATLGRLFGGSR